MSLQNQIPGNGKQPPPNMPKIPIESLELFKCSQCSNDSFVPAVELRFIPRFLSAAGKSEILQTSIMICALCGKKVLKQELEKTGEPAKNEDKKTRN